ncbi:BMP family ABC transporter substrate-binding protein [Naasia aerilata]|uniref:BMP family ABC transporter substrate-binding protein n=1 Tax=Naasia aerilata TaxID=1162966 RepID=A0ABM8GC66_9MICO|nr:BMP family ABC transporter substrate-binding protein [Naasia aerilata]BDZ45845.1 BMP family ABC transporter substrate-binding protein [Naasia aerilata]
MIITPRRGLAAFASVGAAALLLAGCAPAPSSSGSSTAAGGSDSGTDVVPCMVSDTGGFDDHSFNQLGAEGLEDGAKAIGAKATKVQSDTDADYAPNIDNLLSQGCTLIFTVGFNLSAATVEAAQANSDVDFAIIDDAADNDFDGKTDADNIKPILFDTSQAAFLAGYAAASYSKTGIVGTYGGMNFPTVSIFMDGFAQGVAYFNTQKGKSVQVLGWDSAKQDGTFIGGFEAGTDSLQAAQNLIDQGADVILPVGGPIYQSAAQAIKDSGKDIALIGCDADLYESDPKYKDIYLTSILKGMRVGTADVIEQAADSGFDTTPYLGTLENEGVGIAPFHDFESKVPSELQGELDDIQSQIVSGDLQVKSYLAS